MGAQRFRRSDGVLGVGFQIEFGGLPQLSIAWPDGPATRHTLTEAQRLGVERGDLSANEPDEPVVPKAYADKLAESVRELVAENKNLKAEYDALINEIAGRHVAEPAEPTAPSEPAEPASQGEEITEADAIRTYLAENPKATNKSVIAALKERGIEINSSQVSRYRSELKS